MNDSQKKIYLMEYRCAAARAERTRRELERWRSIAERVTPSLSDAPRGASDGSRTERAAEQIDALRLRLADELGLCAARRLDVDAAFAHLDSERLRWLMEQKYVDGRTFEQIADAMELSYQWVCALYKKALAQILNDPPPAA